MSSERECSKCGIALPVDAPKGLCPRCLLVAALNPPRRTAAQTAFAIEPGRQGSTERIDRYEILQKLGEGGFGVVYLAEQTEPVRRQVALKVIKLGMDTKQFIARFEAERPGTGTHGPSEHREGFGCGGHLDGQAVLCDGIDPRRSHH